jgi:hypothetical protein
MASDARGVNDPSAVVAAALLTRICLLPLMLIPYLVGAAARDFAVAPRQLGFVAGGIIGGVIAVMASSVLWVRKFTNAACVRLPAQFRFHFGSASLARHFSEAVKLGVMPALMDVPSLAFDVDEPADVHCLRARADVRYTFLAYGWF